MKGTRVAVDVRATPSQVVCAIRQQGRTVIVTFTDDDVLVDIPGKHRVKGSHAAGQAMPGMTGAG